MNKTELIDAMAADAGISKAAAKKGLESFLGSVSGTLKKGGRVSLVGFGSWSVSRRAARDGRNPQTGATIKIAAKNVVKFKAGVKVRTFVLVCEVHSCLCFDNFQVKQLLEYLILINRANCKCVDFKEYVDEDFGGFADFGD
jgi:DNA-binding protein HU-beta